MRCPFLMFSGLLLASAFGGLASAESPADVLVKNRWMEITRGDYEAELARVPANMRFEFATSPKRVQALLNNLLVSKTLAAQARAHGANPAGSFSSGRADSERALASAELRRIEADAAQSFDARKSAFDAKAREVYTLDREKYRVPEEVRLSDIAVSIKERGKEVALARAQEARLKVIGGEDFAAVAREYSDDPTTRDKGGALPFVSAKRLAPDYAKAVFALSRVGEISQPIGAPAAYHVVRLEERRPSRVQSFNEVRDQILQTLRTQYVDEQRDLRIQGIHNDPELQVNQAEVNALVNRVDPKMFDPRNTKSAAPTAKAAPSASTPE